ncbi:unnamed protein product, partial [Rotaria magnacalcarata]
ADTGATSTSAKKTKADGDVDVEAAARNNSLTKLTIPILKEYCKGKNLKASGTRKQDLIDVIQKHIGIDE